MGKCRPGVSRKVPPPTVSDMTRDLSQGGANFAEGGRLAMCGFLWCEWLPSFIISSSVCSLFFSFVRSCCSFFTLALLFGVLSFVVAHL